jgi:hypothetical protein
MNTIQDIDITPQYKFEGKEKDVEDHIISNIHEISENCMWGEIKRIETQFVIPLKNSKIRADIMIWHTDGTGTVIEVKKSETHRSQNLSAIGQALFYGRVMEKTLTKMPRMVVASNEISRELYDVIHRFKLPINLLMVDNDRFIYLSSNG